MKYLLDTHVFLWLNNNPEKLSKDALNVCQNFQNSLYLSLVSVWEIQIKSQLNKLKLNIPLPKIIGIQQKDSNINILSINLSHIYAIELLPFHHQDPFDRLLVAQALVEDMFLVTADSKLKSYMDKIIW